jgi:hypothetical protein
MSESVSGQAGLRSVRLNQPATRRARRSPQPRIIRQHIRLGELLGVVDDSISASDEEAARIQRVDRAEVILAGQPRTCQVIGIKSFKVQGEIAVAGGISQQPVVLREPVLVRHLRRGSSRHRSHRRIGFDVEEE